MSPRKFTPGRGVEVSGSGEGQRPVHEAPELGGISRGGAGARGVGSAPSDAVEMTRQLVAVPSVNPSIEAGGGAEGPIARLTADWLTEWGWDARVIECGKHRFNVSAVRGDSGPSLLLNGHLDTVGIRGMTVAPFGTDSTSDRIVGRGSCDMKSGVAIVLETARRAALEDWPGRLHILLTGDEEHASIGMQAAVRDGLSADLAVVTEPTSLAVMPAHKGFSWVKATFTGRAAHGSRPEVGVDAVLAASRFLVALGELDTDIKAGPAHPLLGHGSWHVGTMNGGVAPSVYPEHCEVVLERRTLPSESEEEFIRDLQKRIDALVDAGHAVNATLEQDLLRPGSDVAPDHPVVTGLLRACEDEGVPPRVEGMTAWVDAAYLNLAGIPAVCFGPGSIGKAHSADEDVPISEIEAGARVLVRFSRDFLTGSD